MKRPITKSCIVVVLEKQIVRRTNRLIRVRKLMCLLSIFLCVLFANGVLLWVDVPLVGAPSIRIRPHDPKRLQQCLQLQKDGTLSSAKDIGKHLPTVMIDRVS